MHENLGNSVIFYAHYTTDGVLTAGLTVTIDVYEVIRDGSATLIVNDGACTEIGAGLYRYLLAAASVDAAAEYVGVFHTATDTVDAQDIPAIWVINRANTQDIDDILVDTGTTLPAEHAALPTAAEIVAAIGSNVNTNAAVATALTITDGGSIPIYRDTTVVINFAGLGDVSAYSAAGDIAWFTIKENLDDADTSSILQMKTTSFGDSGAASTLLYVNGAAPTATDEGSFLFTDYVTGAATATLKAVAAVDLPIYAVTPVYWDIKATTAAGVVTILATGTAYIYATSTRTIA